LVIYLLSLVLSLEHGGQDPHW